MPLSANDLKALSKVAINAALDAGHLIASRSTGPVNVQHKTGGDSLASQVVTEVDLQSDAIISERLRPSCEQYDIALLTEEGADDLRRLETGAFWCVDPLDGTLDFIESTPGYSVSIALVTRSGLPLIGVVYDPVTKRLYSAIKGEGACLNGKPWRLDLSAPVAGKPLTLVCDRSMVERGDYRQVINHFESIADRLGLSGLRILKKGGAVMNACRVLENRPACYLKFPKAEEGGGSLWDFAATTCIFNEMGAIATDFHGDPLDLNRPESTFMNHRGVMFATDHELVVEVRRTLGEGAGVWPG